MRRTKSAARIAATFAFTLSAALLAAGCGGSGNGSPVNSSGGSVTSRSEGNYSQDALMLAAKRSSDPRISADEAKQIDADLTKIRAAVPAVTNIHALTDFELHTVIADVKPDAAYLSAWRQGNQTTGEPALDAVLSQYGLTRVESFMSGNALTFALKFTDPLNIPALMTQIEQASPSFKALSRNVTIGDGDRIILSVTADKREYAFSHGWGDCNAGCIARHTWTISLDASGFITVNESGPAPPQETAVTP